MVPTLTVALLLLAVASTYAVESISNNNIDSAVLAYIGGDITTYGDISEWDTSEVTTMSLVFIDQDQFDADLSQWDVSKVTSMQWMFSGAYSFTGGDLSNWDVSKVANMDQMFYETDASTLDVSTWDTSNVVSTKKLFQKTSFAGDISNWDTSKVTSMYQMFASAKSFDSDISQWNVSQVTSMYDMFYDTQAFDIDLSDWDVGQVTEMRNMFQSSNYSQQLCWDVNDDVNMDFMFDNSGGGEMYCDPTNAPSQAPTTNPSLINNPFSIISGLSTDNEKWCIFPANNYLASDTKIVLSKCKDWKSYNWVIDDEGKIKNYKDPSLCIHMQGKRILIRKCVDGLRNQKWRYSTQKRLTTKNGVKGASVEDDMAFENGLVKHLISSRGGTTGSEMWSFEYTFGTLSVPSYNTFRIVSDLSTKTNMWCIYPARNVVNDGMKMVISSCKNWSTFKWMIDSQGKISNVMDPEKCITRLGKRLQINDCTDNSKFQRWVYNLIDKKLSALVNGQLQATIVQSEAASNIEVRGLQSVEPGPSHQKWEFEEI